MPGTEPYFTLKRSGLLGVKWNIRSIGDGGAAARGNAEPVLPCLAWFPFPGLVPDDGCRWATPSATWPRRSSGRLTRAERRGLCCAGRRRRSRCANGCEMPHPSRACRAVPSRRDAPCPCPRRGALRSNRWRLRPTAEEGPAGFAPIGPTPPSAAGTPPGRVPRTRTPRTPPTQASGCLWNRADFRVTYGAPPDSV